MTQIAEQVLDRLEDGDRLLLLTDYDGTLAPIVPSPEAACLPAIVRADLQVLARLPRVRVGVVSGRDLADLRKRVAVSDAIYAGCYGLEIEGPGMRFAHPDAQVQGAAFGAISRQLIQRASGVPGMHVELKRFGLTLHYRHIAQNQLGRVETELAQAMLREGCRLRIFHATQAIEIQPQVDWTKGDSVLWIRDAVRGSSEDPWTVVYIGDDWTDEHAFEALLGQGLTISVGDRVPASRATHRVADVTAVRQLLAALAARAGKGDRA